MIAEHRAVAALRVFLVLLFGVLVVFQWFSFPGQFAHMAQVSPADAWLRWPATIVAGFVILCVQVVVVSTWRLLTLVKHDRIFTAASLGWVDAIVWAIGGGWLVLLAMFLWVGFNADDPGVPMVLFALLTGVTAFGLVVIVMRALLQKATTLRSDLEGVI